MITLKEQLLLDILNAKEGFSFKTIETLDNGEYNERTFVTEEYRLSQLINNYFDDNLHGALPNDIGTTIKGWEFNYEL